MVLGLPNYFAICKILSVGKARVQPDKVRDRVRGESNGGEAGNGPVYSSYSWRTVSPGRCRVQNLTPSVQTRGPQLREQDWKPGQGHHQGRNI